MAGRRRDKGTGGRPGGGGDARQPDDKTGAAIGASRTKFPPAVVFLVLILLSGGALRISYLRELVRNPDFALPQIDPAYHDYWARGLATGDWTLPKNLSDWTDPEIRSQPYLRPPAYPFFLAGVYYLFGGSYLAARIVQMALGLVNGVLAYLLGRRLFGSATGLIFAALMSSYWAFIYFEGELLEPVLLVTLGLALFHVLSLWSDRFTLGRGLAGGVLFGLFALVRSNILLFAPVVLGWSWWVARRRKDHRGAAPVGLGFIAGIALMIAPVTIRNWVVAKDFVLITSNIGISLYTGNHEGANGRYTIIPDLKELGAGDNWTCFDYPKMVRGVEKKLGRKVKHSEVSSYFVDKAMQFIRTHPAQALKLVAIKAALFWGPEEVGSNKVVELEKAHSATLRHLPGFPLPVSLAMVGVLQFFLARRSRGARDELPSSAAARQFEVSILLILFILTYFGSYLPFFVVGRYRMPVVPFLFLFGAYGLYRLGRLFAAGRRAAALGGLAALVALYAIASIHIVPYQPNRAQWHLLRASCYRLADKPDLALQECRDAIAADPASEEGHRRLADLLYNKANYAEAAEHYARAVELRPDYMQARYNLASALRELRRYDEAIVHLRWIVEHQAGLPEAHYLLARTLKDTGDDDGAVEQYRRAIALQPGYYQAHNNLANILIAQGKVDEAIEHYRRALEAKPDYTTARQNLDRALRAKGISN